MIKKLWKGDIRLVVTFWIYFVLVAFIYNVIAASFFDAFNNSYSYWTIFLLLLAFYYIYFPFIFVAVWRSADKYKKSKILANVAQIIIAINVIVYLTIGIGIIRQMFFNHPSVNEFAEVSVSTANEKLPRMLDSETELLSTSFRDNIFSYNYKLVNRDASTFDFGSIKNQLQKRLLQSACNTKEFKYFFKHGISVAFAYEDKKEVSLDRIVISPSDCGF